MVDFWRAFFFFLHPVWKYIAYHSSTCTTVWGTLDWWHILSIQLSPTQVLGGQECCDGWLSQVGVHAEDLSIQQSHMALVKLEQLCSEIYYQYKC